VELLAEIIFFAISFLQFLKCLLTLALFDDQFICDFISIPTLFKTVLL